MSTLIRSLGPTLFLATLLTVGCSGSSTPTAPPPPPTAEATTSATSAGQQQSSASVVVRGMVRDSSNRPIANAQIECLGDVHCGPLFESLSADGHEHHATLTDESGQYECRATSGPGNTAGRFAMNANARSYQVTWHEVSFPDPTCSAGRDGCALTVDFSLADLVDH